MELKSIKASDFVTALIKSSFISIPVIEHPAFLYASSPINFESFPSIAATKL